MFEQLKSPTAIVSHMSIVWGIVLALITILDWNSLEKDPLNEQILTPFITREVSVVFGGGESGGELPVSYDPPQLHYQVDLSFDGVQFLAYFFGPIVLFYLVALGIERRRKF